MAEVLLTRQSHSWYAFDDPKSPRQNPALRKTYFEAVGDLLSDHKYQIVHLEEELGGDPCIVYEAVECWRHHGWIIEGRRGRAGYCFVGVRQPKAWRGSKDMLVKYWRAIFLRPPRKVTAGPPQQLRLPRQFMPVKRGRA